MVRLSGGPRLAALLCLLLGAVGLWLVRRHNSGSTQLGLYERGVQAADRQDLKTAIVEFERCIETNPRFAPAYELLADCELASRHVDRALDVLDRLRAIEPNRAHLVTRIAEAYIPANNLYTLRWAREAVLQEPQSPRARMILALGLARSGDRRDAAAEIKVAESLDSSIHAESAARDMADQGTPLGPVINSLREAAAAAPY